MPLPKEAFTIRGGCSCSAVRFRITVPDFAERPIHYSIEPSEAAAGDPATPHLPVVVTDHCNACRSATSSILPAWILTPRAYMTISCLPEDRGAPQPGPLLFDSDAGLLQRRRLAEPDAGGGEDDTTTARPPYVPAYELLSATTPNHGTWLRFYSSTYDPDGRVKRIVRSFCGRCGTNLAYVAHPMPFSLPDMVDVILGTIDREDLEKPFMKPDHQLWWKYGIPWIQNMVKGLDAGKHPNYRLNQEIEEE